MSETWIAHSRGAGGFEQTMREHVGNVTFGNSDSLLTGAANRCPEFLKQDVIFAGLFHDFGKYSILFKRRLKGEVSGLDHWTPGASVLLKKNWSELAAVAVHGHHVGLEAWAKVSTLKENLISLEARTLTLSSTEELKAALEAFVADGFGRRLPPSGRKLRTAVASMLDARMVLSALVDADYTDTAHHMRGVARPEAAPMDVYAALSNLSDYVGTLGKDASADVLEVRARLRQAAVDAAHCERGLFTLEAPTGSGKTLAMLEFALRHMQHHPELKRIIVALPFLSITDQTVREYKRALKDQVESRKLLEHTSLADWRRVTHGAEKDRVRAAEEAFSEDWLPPVVVTTTVQLFESLFSNHPGTCRKLCSVANSVILVDEVQTLPRHLMSATARALARLAHPDYGCSIVLSTATQPLLSAFEGAVSGENEKEVFNLGWKPVSIVARSAGLYNKTRRYEIDWGKCDIRLSWDVLARELAEEQRALCIVNTRKHARQLTEHILALKPTSEVRHLSTNMCAAHRRAVLAEKLLERGAPCILISTQCVEAGVDLDFPVVYRALAPLDAIAQAAGRCNRAGAGTGQVFVFRPEEEVYPGKLYQQGAEQTDSLRKQVEHLDPQDPSVFDTYFARLYSNENVPGSTKELEEAVRECNFPKVACIYRLIEHKDVVHVLVPYPGAPDV
ncbi:MAG TPA: CRISPR-associated helicase Cas3', partial [Fimbriimonadaceae bacterium]|nr:CRISPR-associated helicase Cas3' [Fimbriimonadaceae bacterium]